MAVFKGAPSCIFNKFDKISVCYTQLKSVTQSLVSLVFEVEYDYETFVRPDRFPPHPTSERRTEALLLFSNSGIA